MECYNQPSGIDDIVKWDVSAFSRTLTDVTQTIEYIYDAHYGANDRLLTLRGIVHQVNAIYAEYKSSTDNPQFSVPVSGLLKNIVKADRDEEEMSGMTFNSYIAVLRNVSIKEVANKQYTT